LSFFIYIIIMNTSNKSNQSFLNKIYPFSKTNQFRNNQFRNNRNVRTNYFWDNWFQGWSTLNWTLLIIIYLAILLIIGYLTVMTVKYLRTKCPRRRNWFQYIFRFRYNDVCHPHEEGETNEVIFLDKGLITPEPPMTMPAPPNMAPSDPASSFDKDEVIEKPKQVFHISNQDYTYNQAKCKCASYGARLATYADMVDAYNQGADWCSYGWSEGQTAYYPTQKCKWEKMKNKEECGKPGINGGFFGNPYLKFGANCFGQKPEGQVVKLKHKKCPSQSYCKKPENYYAANKLATDEIAPFNDNEWSMK